MTLYFQTDEITIYRRRRAGNTHRFSISATYTSYWADIQPASDERIQLGNGRFGAVFTAFVDENVPVKENDSLDVSGKRYAVKGVQIYTGADLISHKELLLVSEDA